MVVTNQQRAEMADKALREGKLLIEIDHELLIVDQGTYEQNSEGLWSKVSDDKKLAKAKEAKFAENKQKRDMRLVAGVEHEGVFFDSDTDSKVNISIQLSEMKDTDTVVWKGINNERVLFTKQDFGALAGLLKKLTVDIWGDGGLDDQYTKAISDAQSLDELEAIEIDYSQI